MTISTTNTADIYTGNGSTTAFPVTFAFFGTGASAELEVVERVISSGAETVKTVTTHYTVTGGSGTTGTVTAVSAPASTVEWHIRRKTTKTQSTDYVENDTFPAASHAAALDRIVVQIQEVAGDLANRAPLLDKTSTIGPVRVIDPTESGQAMIWVGSGLDTLMPSDFPLQEYVDDASGFSSLAGSYADEAGEFADAAAASAASASAHDTAAAASKATASGHATATANDRSAVAVLVTSASAIETAMDNSISAFEVVRNNASAVEVLMSNETSAQAVIAAAISADQVLVANDKSATTVLVASAAAYVATASGHATSAANSASGAEVIRNSASAIEVQATSAKNTASGAAVIALAAAASAADRVATASGHSTAAGASATAAAASALAAANAVGGLVFTFDDATAAADPGAGEFRLNNATPGSATALYIDNADGGGGNVTGWLDAWDDGTNTQKGILLLKGLDEPLAFLMAYVTAVADSTGYRTVTITVLASGGSFVLGDRFMVTFVPAGDKGTDGAGAGDVLGAGNGTVNKFAMWANADTITVGDISSADVVDFPTAVEAVVFPLSAADINNFTAQAAVVIANEFSAREGTKADIWGMTGSDYISPRDVQSANEVVTVTPASGLATLDLGAGRNFRWPISNNATLTVSREKVGMAGMLEIVKTSGGEAVTFLTAFDAANVTLPTSTGADYLTGYYVLSGGDVMILPGGPHV